jgi:hypothetical protein
MCRISKFSLLACLTLSLPAVQAGSISYSASIGCDGTCVTTFVSWQDFNPGVALVLVTDNFGDPLFTLSTDFPPESTGQIDPDPQTITGLTQDQLNLIEGGGSGIQGDVEALTISNSLESDADPGNCWRPGCSNPPPSSADLVFENKHHQVIDEVPFIATTATPEPATGMLTLLSLGALFSFVLVRRRKLVAIPVNR